MTYACRLLTEFRCIILGFFGHCQHQLWGDHAGDHRQLATAQGELRMAQWTTEH